MYANIHLNLNLLEAVTYFAQDVQMQTDWPAAATGSTVSSASFLSASGLVSPLFCASRLLFSSHFILLLFLLLCWGGRPVGQVIKAKIKNCLASTLQVNYLKPLMLWSRKKNQNQEWDMGGDQIEIYHQNALILS